MKISLKSGNKKTIRQQIKEFSDLDDVSVTVEQRVDELIELLEGSDLDSEKARYLTKRFVTAVEQAAEKHRISAFKTLDNNVNLSREEMLENLGDMLAKNPVNSYQSRKYLIQKRLKNSILTIIALLFISLGLAMIILPAPPYFEMFTIFYFNPDDGVTLMDLISLLIIFTGVYLLINSLFLKKKPGN